MVKLRDYQISVVREERVRPNVLIVAPMGAGKTLATLTATTALVLTNHVCDTSQAALSASVTSIREGIKNILIIAPKRVAKSVWAQEAAEYEMPLNIRYCERSADIKMMLVEPAHHRICVCSVTRISEIPHGCWEMVIIDESTLFGNKKSQRSGEARRICSSNMSARLRAHPLYFPIEGMKVQRRILLTGTPIHGGYEKLWHQIFLLDGGAALGKSLTAFREKYMYVRRHAQGAYTLWGMREDMIPQLHEDIKHLVYIVKDCVKLPPMLYKEVYIELPAKRMREYEEFERESIINFQAEQQVQGFIPLSANMMPDGTVSLGGYKRLDHPYKDTKTLCAFAASSRGIKLRQLASGCVYADETNKTYSVTHTEKLDALKEVVEVAERGILVAYSFKSEYNELKIAFPEARRLETAQDIEDWNAGRIPIALVHPASVGHGLNLQHGGCIVVWYSLTYDAELYAQLNKRVHRSGQEDTVSIIHLLARGTIDTKILKALRAKEAKADEFNNSL